MPTRLTEIVIDTPDAVALGRWWADALGWSVASESAAETNVLPPPGAPGIELTFGHSDDPKAGKNRVHLDLTPTDVARLEALGATRIDVGQGDVPWTVLADPDGNEFCVLEPRDEYRDAGAVAAIVVDALDPPTLAAFWAEAAGWPVGRTSPDVAGLRAPSRTGPWLEFVRTTEPHRVKNRWHLDVAGRATDHQSAEVARLQALGARPCDIGQGDDPAVNWVVLADPEDNEFCVLSSRD